MSWDSLSDTTVYAKLTKQVKYTKYLLINNLTYLPNLQKSTWFTWIAKNQVSQASHSSILACWQLCVWGSPALLCSAMSEQGKWLSWRWEVISVCPFSRTECQKYGGARVITLIKQVFRLYGESRGIVLVAQRTICWGVFTRSSIMREASVELKLTQTSWMIISGSELRPDRW